MLRPTLAFVFAFPLLAFAAAPAPKAAEETKLFFPTKVGDRWIYLFTVKKDKTKDEESEIEEAVTAVEDKKGVKVVTVGRLENDGKVHTNRMREVSEKGVWQMESPGFEPLKTPWVHLKLPHKPGLTWDDDEHERGMTLTTHGPDRVKVPAGEYDAIRVEKRKKGDPKAEPIQTDWYAPRVGIVKLTSVNLLVVMKSFTAGKGKN